MIQKHSIPGNNPEQKQNLPKSLVEVAEVIGLPATRKLVETHGGTRVFVPRRLKTQHKLANLLGFEKARRLSAHFGGESLNIARAASIHRAKRNVNIVRCYDAGRRVPSLAQEHGLTERQIYTILSKTVQPKTTRQACSRSE